MSPKKAPGVCKPVETKSGVSYRAVLSLGRRPDGGRDQRRVSAATAAECEAKARKLLVERDERRLANAGPLTVECYLLDRWLPAKEARNELAPGTAAAYERTIRLHLLPALGAVRLDRVSPADVERLYVDRARVLGPATLRRLHAILSGALRRAARQGLIPRNPCEAVGAPRAEEPEIVPWTAAEQSRFLDSTAGDPDHALWRVLMLGGLRMGEARALRWADVDLAAPAVAVPRTMTKDRRDRWVIGTRPKSAAGRRTVPLTPACGVALRAQRDRVAFLRALAGAAWHGLDLVFPGEDGRPLAHNAAAARLDKAAAAAGLPRLTLHGLRHTQGTQLMRLGVHPKVAQRRLGHADIRQTLRYAHVAEADQDAVAARLAEALGQVGGEVGDAVGDTGASDGPKTASERG